MFYSLNNKIFKETEHNISINNRSFRYGDGFFETIKLIDNSIQLKQYHFNRIAKSIDILKFELPKYFSFDTIMISQRGKVDRNGKKRGRRAVLRRRRRSHVARNDHRRAFCRPADPGSYTQWGRPAGDGRPRRGSRQDMVFQSGNPLADR